MCAHVEAKGFYQVSSLSFSNLIFETRSLTKLGTQHLARLDIQQALESHLSPPAICHTQWFVWCWGFELVPLHAELVLHLLSLFHSPLFTTLDHSLRYRCSCCHYQEICPVAEVMLAL